MPSKRVSSLEVFGLKSCDTCRKARRWLQEHDVSFLFHDVREDRLEPGQVAAWMQSEFAPRLLNRNSTTWRQLPDADKVLAESAPARLITAHPTLLKRPVFTRGSRVLAVGFKPQDLGAVLGL